MGNTESNFEKQTNESDKVKPIKEDVLTDSDVSQAKHLDITDLANVMKNLKSIDYTQWITLGISLGLHYNTLGVIEEKCRGDVKQCLLKCMAAWLRGEDKVTLKGGPSWLSLAEALEEIEENDIARNIRAK
uniref:Uncharacterized protein n=1 Tax=Amphimedon queenslandica TaxID=400682 RepID=A0A1X7TMI4_AMPQE